VLLNCSNCPSTCKDYRLPETCSDPDQCEPGCGCPDGQVLYDGVCIPSIQCPCYNDAGDEVPEGFTYAKSKCEEWYVFILLGYGCGLWCLTPL
jgi:hypothetical protein